MNSGNPATRTKIRSGATSHNDSFQLRLVGPAPCFVAIAILFMVVLGLGPMGTLCGGLFPASGSPSPLLILGFPIASDPSVVLARTGGLFLHLRPRRSAMGHLVACHAVVGSVHVLGDHGRTSEQCDCGW